MIAIVDVRLPMAPIAPAHFVPPHPCTFACSLKAFRARIGAWRPSRRISIVRSPASRTARVLLSRSAHVCSMPAESRVALVRETTRRLLTLDAARNVRSACTARS